MVGRGEAKQARSTGSSQRLKKDRISELPDPLMCQILSHLPLKDAVKTSVLSTRWRTLWLWVPSLELADYDFPDFNAFKSFGDKFFDSDKVSCIHKLNLDILHGTGDGVNADSFLNWFDAAVERKIQYKDETEDGVNDDVSFLKSWIVAAVERKIQHLYVRCPPADYIYEVPISLYICETLVSLNLQWVVLADDAGFVSLPCLKNMQLMYVWYPNEATFERLVSCCPALEELEIQVCGPKVFRVQSLSLKRLVFVRAPVSSQFDSVPGVVIVDAPPLRFLKIDDGDSVSCIIKNLDSNAKLDISLGFRYAFDEASVSSKRSSIRDFLPGISKLGEMIISLETFKVFHLYSKLEPLPQFDHMSRLDATVCLSDLKWLPTFLERCPNLNSLVLALDNYIDEIGSEEVNQISFSSVPECLLSSLKSVVIKSSISGNAAEMNLVRYLLENSIILERLTLRLSSCANKTVVFKKLLEIPRRSIKCQVVAR